MGRLFIKYFEEPAYKCKYCPIEFALYHDDQIRKEPPFTVQINILKVYKFPKCFNIQIRTTERTFTWIRPDGQRFERSMFQVFCIGCGSRIGLYYENAEDTSKYFYLIRSRIHAPPEGSDNENPQN